MSQSSIHPVRRPGRFATWLAAALFLGAAGLPAEAQAPRVREPGRASTTESWWSWMTGKGRGPAPAASPRERPQRPAPAQQSGARNAESRTPVAAAGGRVAAPTGGPAVVRAGGASAARSPSGDRAVVQAGAMAIADDCGRCGERDCRRCRVAEGLHGVCNGRCEGGGCPAHCPVRPGQFGYYSTRWRNWPGRGVKQVSHFDPATTPVEPPRAQVPTAEEESGVEPDDMELDDDAPAEDDPGAEPAATPDDGGAERMKAPADPGAPLDRSGDEAPALEEPAATDGATSGVTSPDPAPFAIGPLPVRGVDGGSAGGDGPINPLRYESASDAPQAPSGEAREPTGRGMLPPSAATREGEAASGWRSATRRRPADATPLRGVTANPGNPLR